MPNARFQFSIRWIFAVTAIVGLALAVLSAKPSWISGLLIQLIFLAMPGLVTILLVAGRGYARSFAIGAVAPTLIGFAIAGRYLVADASGFRGTWKFGEIVSFMFEQDDLFRALAIFIWSATLLGGAVAVVIRWLIGTTPEGR